MTENEGMVNFRDFTFFYLFFNVDKFIMKNKNKDMHMSECWNTFIALCIIYYEHLKFRNKIIVRQQHSNRMKINTHSSGIKIEVSKTGRR